MPSSNAIGGSVRCVCSARVLGVSVSAFINIWREAGGSMPDLWKGGKPSRTALMVGSHSDDRLGRRQGETSFRP